MRTTLAMIAPWLVSIGLLGSVEAATPVVTGPRADICSRTAVGLFRDRVQDPALEYEVLRDDGLTSVTNVINGVSYYADRRLPGATDPYILTTIDETGTRSRPVSIVVPPG